MPRVSRNSAAQAAQPGCKRFFSVVGWLRTTLGSFCQVTDMQLTRWWGKLVCFTGTQGRLQVGALLRSLGRTLSAMNSQSGVPRLTGHRPQTLFFDLFLHCPIFLGFSLPQKTSVIWLRNGRSKKTIEVVARAPQAAVGVRRACPKLIFCEPCGDKRRADWLNGSQQ